MDLVVTADGRRSFSRILSDRGEIDFASSKLQPGKVVYEGCPHDAEAETIPLCWAELNLTSVGSVSRIVFTYVSP